MATVGDNLRANIRIGGTIDPSWKKSTEGLKRGLAGATQEVARLTRQQDVLKRKIQAGVLAGQDITDLRKQYEKLKRKINDAAAEQERFNRQLERAERLERWKGRAGTFLKTGLGLSVGSGLTLAAGAQRGTEPEFGNGRAGRNSPELRGGLRNLCGVGFTGPSDGVKRRKHW
ncbi:hypothetical protein QDW63_23725 [Escherichia coli]|nr:hypothetical protein QDW63_23725 [Escherichia coli]